MELPSVFFFFYLFIIIFLSIMVTFFPHLKQVPLMRIKSLCQNRIPGSIAQVHVEPLCEPGEVCQDHLRMTLDTGQTIYSMLIPIWVILTMFI